MTELIRPMKKVVVALLTLGFASCATSQDELPGGAVQKGSLSNQKLIQDAMLGVLAKVATLGCKNPESFDPYVLEQPKGVVGSRIWKELWIVKGCGTEYPIRMRFSEDGTNAANYFIE